jgi:hypothetical protein
MKTKLTLTVEKSLIPKSKQYARRMGKSVSQLVEDLLREKIGENKTSFSSRWRGQFRSEPKETPRYEKLSDRYLS